MLALVPAASAGHYWAAPALGLGVAALAASSGWLTTALSQPLVVVAGEASYALYMTHLLVQPFVHSLRVWAQGSWWAGALVVAGLVVTLAGIAWAVHTLVERPARRLLQARRPDPAPAMPVPDSRQPVRA